MVAANIPTAVQTTGTVSAQINNPQSTPAEFDFLSDSHDVGMYREGGKLHIETGQNMNQGSLDSHLFSFKLRDLRPGDSEVILDFSNPADASGFYGDLRMGVYKPHPIRSGSLTVSLDANERLTGFFSCEAYWGSEKVEITTGRIDLVGFITPDKGSAYRSVSGMGTGTMEGELLGGPFPQPQFAATSVSRRYSPPFSSFPGYWVIIGEWSDAAFPFSINKIFVYLYDTASGNDFDFSKDRDVDVTYLHQRSTKVGRAVSGTLKFDTRPESGTAKGEVDCTMDDQSNPIYALKFTFNVT